MKTLHVEIEGVAPILLHSGRTKDPTDEMTKAIKKITGKRKKTDADYEEVKRLELMAGLYFDDKDKIYVPDINIERSIYEGSKQDRNGKKFLSGFMVDQHAYLKNGKSVYTVTDVMNNLKHQFTTSVAIQRVSVMRTRPRFDVWSLEFSCTYNEGIINPDEVKEAIKKAGQLVGIGDWRPKFGRFKVLSIEDI